MNTSYNTTVTKRRTCNPGHLVSLHHHNQHRIFRYTYHHHHRVKPQNASENLQGRLGPRARAHSLLASLSPQQARPLTSTPPLKMLEIRDTNWPIFVKPLFGPSSQRLDLLIDANEFFLAPSTAAVKYGKGSCCICSWHEAAHGPQGGDAAGEWVSVRVESAVRRAQRGIRSVALLRASDPAGLSFFSYCAASLLVQTNHITTPLFSWRCFIGHQEMVTIIPPPAVHIFASVFALSPEPGEG